MGGFFLRARRGACIIRLIMGLRILSICDGIGCGRFALARAGADVEAYFRVECEFAKGKDGKYSPSNTQWPARIGDSALARFGDCVRLRGKHPHLAMAAEDFGAAEAEFVGRIDLVIAGFPCQPYSAAGLRAGFEDPRAKVLDDVLRIIKLVKAPAFVLENVKAATPVRNALAAKIGAHPTTWNSVAFGAQSRERDFYASVPTRAPLRTSPRRVGDVMLAEDDERLDGVRYYHWRPLEKERGRFVCVVGKKGSFAGLWADVRAGRILEDDGDYSKASQQNHEKSGKPSQNYQVIDGRNKSRAQQSSGNAASQSGVYDLPSRNGNTGGRGQPAESCAVRSKNGKNCALKAHMGDGGAAASGIIAVEERLPDGEKVQSGEAKAGALECQWSAGRANPVAVEYNGGVLSQSQSVHSGAGKSGALCAAGTSERNRGALAMAGLFVADECPPQAMRVHSDMEKSPSLTAQGKTGGHNTDGLVVAGGHPAQAMRAHSADGFAPTITATVTRRGRTDGLIVPQKSPGQADRVYGDGKKSNALSDDTGGTNNGCVALDALLCRPLCITEMLRLMHLPDDFDFGEASLGARRSGIGNGFDVAVVAAVLKQVLRI